MLCYVRKFVQSREKLKDLLCEAYLAIMPSKTEEFGLVAVQALSAGLPILVGSKSGMAKALENGPHGITTCTCIVCSDDPAEWAKAIEGVRCSHQIQLEMLYPLSSKSSSSPRPNSSTLNSARSLGFCVKSPNSL